MNRGQRRMHLVTWLVIVPLALAILMLAWQERPTRGTPAVATEGGR